MAHTAKTGQEQTSRHRLMSNSSIPRLQLSLRNRLMVYLLGQQYAVFSNCQHMRASIARSHTEQDWRHHNCGMHHYAEVLNRGHQQSLKKSGSQKCLLEPAKARQWTAGFAVTNVTMCAHHLRKINK